MQKSSNNGVIIMTKYIYKVKLENMEATYFEHTKTDFFANDDERSKFNAVLIVEADSEQESEKIRMGMTYIRMWELDHTE
jgi:hypothetical protein